jgi:hypothetical protein
MTHQRRLMMLMLLAASAAAPAADLDLTFHAGDTYTDNSLRIPDGPSDNIGAAALRLDLTAQGEHYETEVRTAVTYLHYFEGTQENEVLRGFAGDVSFFIVPERFTWIIQENYGPVLENPLSPDRPDNWTYDSYFTTGPDLQLGDTGQFHTLLSGRYSRADYESELVPSNEQYTGLLSFALASDGRNERSLQISAKRVEEEAIDRPPIPVPANGYDIQEAYLRWASEMKRGGFYIDAGATSLSDEGVTSTSPLLRLGLDRTISRTLSLSLGLGTQYSDNMRRFARLQDESPDIDDPRDDITPTTAPLQEEYVDATLQYQTARTSAALRVAYNVLEQQNTLSPLKDQEYSNVTLEFERQISPRFKLEFGAMFDRRDYGDFGRSDDDFFTFLAGAWRLDKDLEARLTARMQERDSSDPTADFTEKSVQLEFVYYAYQRQEPRRHKRFLDRDLR